MAYASIEDIAASWDQYQRLLARVAEPLPNGLSLYLAGPTEDGVRIITVWEDEHARERFRRDRLAPALAAISRPAARMWAVRDLRLAHVVLGSIGPPIQTKE